jgi:type VI secretion system protein ImpF
MARHEPEPNVTLSVLDRLLDNNPETPADPPFTRSQSLRQLKTALKRDLEWLLNTRRTPEPVDDPSRELYRSLFNYGLPDFSGISVNSPQDRQKLVWMMESAVAIFEPRIQGVTVTMEQPTPNSRMVRFQIHGLLRIDPAPERVTFDTVLELTSGEYEVRGE